MSHGINAYYRNQIGAAGQVQNTPAARPPSSSPEVRQANQVAPAKQASATAAMSELSEAESQMIDRYFPASEAMSLRLYGPGSQARTMNASVGTRLDIQG